MASLEMNKVVAAVLTAGIVFMGGGELGRALLRPERPHQSAIQIGGAPAAAPVAAAPAATIEPIGPLLASANPQAGQALATKLCGACHNFAEGGKNGVGPNLYGIIGAAHGHAEGFNYSAAIKGKAGPWTPEEMNAWLLKPATYAPGTRMAFAGISAAPQRADVIAYLRSISPNAPK